jgi:surface polysaccharide O-acyltransferase-like enzyme
MLQTTPRAATTHAARHTAAIVSLRVTAPRAETKERLDALDALRAAAMLLGVVLHASISYMTCRMPNLLWGVHDASHATLDWLFWWIHSFRLPLFFLIAGFFSARLWQRRGADAFLANRTRRILMPLAAACVLVLPATYLVWCAGWLLTGQCTLGQALRIKFAPAIQQDVYGLAHLWFLEHLLLICVGYWLWQGYVAPLLGRQKWIIRIDQVLASRWRPATLAIPAFAIVLIDPDVVAGFHNTFVPETLRLLYYSLYFAVGAALYCRQKPLSELTDGWWIYLALTVPLLISMGLLLRQYLEGGMTLTWRVALAADMALLAALSVFGWLGLVVRFGNRRLPAVAALADASYWVYLTHLPLVGLVQAALYPTTLPIGAKFLAAVIVPLAATLLAYRYLVLGSPWAQAVSGRSISKEATDRHHSKLYASLAAIAVMGIAAGLWHMRAFCFDGNRHVVLPGVAYRSAQPSPAQLRDSIARWSLRSVVNLQGGDPAVVSFAHERRICQAAGVQFLAVDLPEDGLPSRRRLASLVAVLDKAQTPVLLHGRYGIARSGLAAAVARLLAGQQVPEAIGEFSWRHGHFSSTTFDCRQVIESYGEWLAEHGVGHRPNVFRYWAHHEYGPEKILLGRVLANAARERH